MSLICRYVVEDKLAFDFYIATLMSQSTDLNFGLDGTSDNDRHFMAYTVSGCFKDRPWSIPVKFIEQLEHENAENCHKEFLKWLADMNDIRES